MPAMLLGKAAVVLTAAMTACGAALVAGFAGALPPVYSPTMAAGDIPASYLSLYRQDANVCPGLGWPVLAAVGKVESDHGRSAALVSSAGAVGPMQFEPGTWRRHGVDGDGDGRLDPFDPADAVASVAGYLCSLGADHDVRSALVAYNCGNTGPACQALSAGYASLVLSWADRYAVTRTIGVASGTAQVAVDAALSQRGVPYLWGGEGAGGFDCSGLVQWAYARAGVVLPRVAQDQFDAGPQLAPGAPLVPGDLVFFGAGRRAVTHVGVYVGDGRMVDAPHTGAVVRVDVLTRFSPAFVGATRPAGGV